MSNWTISNRPSSVANMIAECCSWAWPQWSRWMIGSRFKLHKYAICVDRGRDNGEVHSRRKYKRVGKYSNDNLAQNCVYYCYFLDKYSFFSVKYICLTCINVDISRMLNTRRQTNWATKTRLLNSKNPTHHRPASVDRSTSPKRRAYAFDITSFRRLAEFPGHVSLERYTKKHFFPIQSCIRTTAMW